jgi:hypothetical protein
VFRWCCPDVRTFFNTEASRHCGPLGHLQRHVQTVAQEPTVLTWKFHGIFIDIFLKTCDYTQGMKWDTVHITWRLWIEHIIQLKSNRYIKYFCQPECCQYKILTRVFCSIELMGVMCSFVHREYSFCVVMYCSVCICMNYDISVVIWDIVYESRLASCEYVVITIVLFVFYTCILCLDHVIVSACCMLCILSMYYNLSLANAFGLDRVLKCLFAFILCLSDLCCPSGRLLYLFLLGGLA